MRAYQVKVRTTPIPINLYACKLPVRILLEAVRMAGYKISQDGRGNYFLVMREGLQ